jgi:hypothetical protein
MAKVLAYECKSIVMTNTSKLVVRFTHDGRPQQEMRVMPFLSNPNKKYTPLRALEFHTRITEKYYGDGYAEK